MNHERSYIVAKIICDRNFDVPEWIYDNVDEKTILKIIEMQKVSYAPDILISYIYSSIIRNFFDTIRDRVKFSNSFIKYIIDNSLMEYALLLFKKSEYKYYKKLYDKKDNEFKKSIISLICRYALQSDIFISRVKEIVKYSGVKKQEFILIGNKICMEQSMTKNNTLGIHDYHNRMDRLMRVLDVSSDYKLCDFCLNLGIPVFYKFGDSVDLNRYIDCILENNWKVNIDLNILNVDISNNMDMYEKVYKLSYNIDMHGLMLLKKITGDSNEFKIIIHEIPNHKNKVIPIKNFNYLIDLFGHNPYGLPIYIQQHFIKCGGDIKTMFNENGLLSEATILKSMDYTDYLIDTLSIESLRFLIYNSVDFVKNIITTKTFVYKNLSKLGKAIFEYPINEELWEVLNSKNGNATNRRYGVDYRVSLVRLIISYLGIDGLYNNVPEAMAYRAPGAFYITRNLSKDNMRFVPVENLVPYIKGIISREEYVPFNLYCNGKYVSLSKVFSDQSVLIQNIVTYRKYGYICDITDVDHDKLLDTICNK